MSDLQIGRFAGGPAAWDAFARAQTGFTHFHLYGWRTVIERVFRHECIYLAATHPSGRIVAILPMVRVRSLLFGHYLMSMPFVNYGGPLGTAEGVRALSGEAEAIAARDGVKLLELRSRVELPLDMSVSHRKVTVVLDLPNDPDVLWASLPGKLRSQIKRPRKDGVEVRFGLREVRPFYTVFAHHMRDLGTPVMPRSFFETVATVFPEDVEIGVAYHNGLPIACGCGFRWRDEFEITWASALRSYNSMSPNMLLYWALIERVTRDGARVFNLGRCSPGSGTHRFKLQWRGREEALWWYQRSATDDSSTASTPSQRDGPYVLASRVWQRLPLGVTTRLGPAIVRFIP